MPTCLRFIVTHPANLLDERLEGASKPSETQPAMTHIDSKHGGGLLLR